MCTKFKAQLRGLVLCGILAGSFSGCVTLEFGGATGDGGIRRSVGACAPVPCLRFDVDPIPSFPPGIPNEHRSEIEADVAALLYASPDSDSTPHATAASLSREIEDNFREYDVTFASDDTRDWYLERRAAVIFSNRSVITFDVRSTGYLGGAHGFEERRIRTYRLSDGKPLTLEDVIGDAGMNGFVTAAESEIRRVRGIRLGVSFAEAGLEVNIDTLKRTSQNFGLTERGLLVFYNPYDIAPYSMGSTEIVLPKEALAVLAPRAFALLEGEAAPQL